MTIKEINILISKLMKLRDALTVAENQDIIPDPQNIKDKVAVEFQKIKDSIITP